MKYKIKKIRKERGLTQAALVDAAEISQPYLSQLENGSGGRAPSMETLLSIANVLEVRPSDLLDDAKSVAVVGRVGAGARVPLVDAYEKGDGLYHVACPSELPHNKSVVAVEVEGDSMDPLYQEGDLLFYTRSTLGVPTEAVGRICVCEDEDGDAWVKLLRLGEGTGKFDLISLNPFVGGRSNVVLKWASPVTLAWPNALVERMEEAAS